MYSIYQQKAPVLFGCGAVKGLGDKVRELGGTKVFCVYDAGVAASGIADRIVGILETAGLEVVTYDKVGSEAPNTAVDAGADFARASGVDCVVGVGGGSCLDVSKFFAVLLKHPGKVSDYYAFKVPRHLPTVPIILVPTCSGTGSEVTAHGVVHDEELNKKIPVLCYSNLAILDPELCVTAPPKVTAFTGMDAMSHAVEAYTSNETNPKSDLLALDAIRRISTNLERAYIKGADIEARTELVLASNFAGLAFNDAGVHYGHAIAHFFGLELGIPHGIGCALVLPEILAFSNKAVPERIEDIRKALGAADGQSAAEFVRELMRRVSIPSLASMGHSREKCVSIAGKAMSERFVAKSAFTVDESILAVVIAAAYDNYK